MRKDQDEDEELYDGGAPDTDNQDDEEDREAPVEGGFDSIQVDLNDPAQRRQLRGMYQSWYLDYASYTILDRAIPHISDGLKPVQRRIMHAMKTLDDGRFNKVANIVGTAMQYHPHGDASIYGALVQLGQKDLLVDTQGNWGNTLTGASAAAARYIEARLSKFALEVLFDPNVTQWTLSYDGRKKEPITLPAKFPILLSQGVGGIAAGLSSLILPHNFNEICDAAIAYLRGEPFELYPDFQTGAMADVSRYNDGQRGGRVRIRARIEKIDNKTLAITAIPFGLTTDSLIDSIIKANEKGKIKIHHIDDNTANTANVVIHLLPGTSSDKTIDALYAFTDCELTLSPNCCVIYQDKPHFIGVSDVLRHNADYTREILRRELEIEKAEVSEMLFFASLEKIFIEQRIYKDPEYEQGTSDREIFAHIMKRLSPFVDLLQRSVTDDDLQRLEQIPMKRIHRYSSDKADRLIANYHVRIESIDEKLANITRETINHFAHLKEEYGHNYPRLTQLRSFDTIEATTVAEQNEKLYLNREEGFVGTALKKDEFICSCSKLDEIIIFYKDGRYKVTRVADKLFIGKNVIYIDVFRRGDDRTIYNVIYQDGKGGPYYMKRFNVTGVTRDREYNLTMGAPGSRIVYFTANPNGEAEIVRVTLKPKPRLKNLQFDIDFADLAIKGRAARGNIVTRNEAHRFVKRKSGTSTLGGREVWFDPDVLRLNYDGRGQLLGEFGPNDMILVVLKSGEYYTSTFDVANHYDENILRIEKYRPGHVFTAIVNDADQGYPYLKRFAFEPASKRQRFIGENAKSSLILLTDEPGARFEVAFPQTIEGIARPKIEIIASEFVAVKSFKAKGKRITNFTVDSISELPPLEIDIDDEEKVPDAPENDDIIEPDKSDDEIRDEITGQQRIF